MQMRLLSTLLLFLMPVATITSMAMELGDFDMLTQLLESGQDKEVAHGGMTAPAPSTTSNLGSSAELDSMIDNLDNLDSSAVSPLPKVTPQTINSEQVGNLRSKSPDFDLGSTFQQIDESSSPSSSSFSSSSASSNKRLRTTDDASSSSTAEASGRYEDDNGNIYEGPVNGQLRAHGEGGERELCDPVCDPTSFTTHPIPPHPTPPHAPST